MRGGEEIVGRDIGAFFSSFLSFNHVSGKDNRVYCITKSRSKAILCNKHYNNTVIKIMMCINLDRQRGRCKIIMIITIIRIT